MQIEMDGELAKVSEYVTMKIGLPNYSHVELNFGHGRPCANTPPEIKRTAAAIHKLNMEMIERRIKEYVELAEDILDR